MTITKRTYTEATRFEMECTLLELDSIPTVKDQDTLFNSATNVVLEF